MHSELMFAVYEVHFNVQLLYSNHFFQVSYIPTMSNKLK